MALTDYERYQLEWMIEHGHSLMDFVRVLDIIDLDGMDGLEEAYGFWERDYGFGGECFACEAEWRDAEGRELEEERGRIAELKAWLAGNPEAGTDEVLDNVGGTLFGDSSMPTSAIVSGLLNLVEQRPAPASREDRSSLADIALDARGLDRALEEGGSVRDWYMEAYPDDDLGASIDPQLTFDRALNAVAFGGGFYDALGVGDSVVRERVFHELSERTGIAYDDIYGTWLGEKAAKVSSLYGITKDMVRRGIEQGVIRFEANPDPTDPWKTMCCVGEGGGLFFFTDTTDISVTEYIRMNRNNLDMVVDDVWEALNDGILRDFPDDYERYASILCEPHEGGTSSLSMPEDGRLQAVQPQGVSLRQAAREAREASDALTERKTADDPGGKYERER